MTSKTPLSLVDRLRSAVSSLGGAADRTLRRMWGTTPPAATGPEPREATADVAPITPPPVSPAVPKPKVEAMPSAPRAAVPTTPSQEVASPSPTVPEVPPAPIAVRPSPVPPPTPIVAAPAAPVVAEAPQPSPSVASPPEIPAPAPVISTPTPVSTAPTAPEAATPSPKPEPRHQEPAAPARDWSLADPLGDTIAALRAVHRVFGGLELWPLPVRPWHSEVEAPAIPEGASFDRHVFTCSAGTRDYRLYVPASAPVMPKGLVVMLHGCRQTPEDFAIGTGMNRAAEAGGFLVVYPHQPVSANANGCWNWHRLADQMRHGGEPAILAGIVCELMEHWGLERDRVFVAGLSAGGAMTSILTHTHPELFAAACIHSGVGAGVADDLRSGLAAMRGRFREVREAGDAPPLDPMPTIVFQGDADPTVHASNADRIFADLAPAGPSETRVQVRSRGGVVSTVTTRVDAAGETIAELWHVADGVHAWFGGDPAGSFAVSTGPDATAEMLRFFAAQGARRRRLDAEARERGGAASGGAARARG